VHRLIQVPVLKEWRRLHNEELYTLYSSGAQIKILRWAGHEAHIRERRGADRVLVGKSEERRSFGKPKLRRKNNIKTDFREVEWMHGLD
jgi:hypothetical protein